VSEEVEGEAAAIGFKVEGEKRVADCVRGGAWERSRARRVRKADARVGGRPARADGKEDGILSPLHSF
jgi:hypothetical protein